MTVYVAPLLAIYVHCTHSCPACQGHCSLVLWRSCSHCSSLASNASRPLAGLGLFQLLLKSQFRILPSLQRGFTSVGDLLRSLSCLLAPVQLFLSAMLSDYLFNLSCSYVFLCHSTWTPRSLCSRPCLVLAKSVICQYTKVRVCRVFLSRCCFKIVQKF